MKLNFISLQTQTLAHKLMTFPLLWSTMASTTSVPPNTQGLHLKMELKNLFLFSQVQGFYVTSLEKYLRILLLNKCFQKHQRTAKLQCTLLINLCKQHMKPHRKRQRHLQLKGRGGILVTKKLKGMLGMAQLNGQTLPVNVVWKNTPRRN